MTAKERNNKRNFSFMKQLNNKLNYFNDKIRFNINPFVGLCILILRLYKKTQKIKSPNIIRKT
jgi:hypothetical protein